MLRLWKDYASIVIATETVGKTACPMVDSEAFPKHSAKMQSELCTGSGLCVKSSPRRGGKGNCSTLCSASGRSAFRSY